MRGFNKLVLDSPGVHIFVKKIHVLVKREMFVIRLVFIFDTALPHSVVIIYFFNK